MKEIKETVELPKYRTAQQLLPSDQQEENTNGGIDIYLVFVQPA